MKKSLCLGFCSLLSVTSYAADTADLAKQLSNPIAAMVSMPFQFNYDENIGANEDIERYTLNIQPVIPMSLNEDWNIISRTVLPVTVQTYGDGARDDDWGTGDTVQSIFLSPKEPGPGGLIWGFGPAMLLPTASEKTLGADQWGLGPTGVVLKQVDSWTFGLLANHIWAVDHKDNAEGISSSFIQPFMSYTYPSSLTLSLNSETTYDWNSEDATIPINFTATKIVNFNGQLISLGGGIRYWAEDTTGSAKDWGGRLIASFIFPK
ncbi:transporter [Acinetobacter zhairhuonensis]|uniref:transporter n=1 Tax=Acinetobacter sp. A7.4 TaxID=2919921 RepID=UPI001F4F4CC3|nr:transporter [Acinetobacter sp. A7.4]MCJ8162065.1 transporter [Acinetobacter sp. A7.4]